MTTMNPLSKQGLMVYRLASLVLTAVMLLSIVMIGTLSWRDATQHDTSEIRSSATPVQYSVVLNKRDKESHEAIAGAEFYLYKKGSGGSVTQVGERFLTDQSGQISAAQLEPGAYYFLETNPTYGYTYDDGITEYPFAINSATPESGVVVNAYNIHLSGDLVVTKEVVNADGSELSAEQLEQEFEFTAAIGGETYEFMLKHGERKVFDALPVGTHYTVKEVPMEGYAIDSEHHRGNIIAGETIAEFVNTYGEIEPGETTLIIKKLVQGEGANLEKAFNFVLLIDGKEHSTFALQHKEEKRFTFPSGTLFEVYEEDSISEGYTQTSVLRGYGTATGETIKVIQTNTYVRPPCIEIAGKKSWDMNGFDVEKPKSITVYLMNGTTRVASKTVTASDKWQYSFSIPKYDCTGSPIVYTIQEKEIPGYISKTDGYNLKNTYLKPAEYSPPVKKTITGDTPKVPAKFTFQMTADDDAPMPTGAVNGVKTASILGAGKVEFDIMRYHSAGTYLYTVSELAGAENGYTYDKTVYTMTVATTCPESSTSDPSTTATTTTVTATTTTRAVTTTTTTTTGAGQSDGPKTGDTSNMTLWFILMIASAFCLRWVIARIGPVRRKRKQ